jgi:hypothetical protein
VIQYVLKQLYILKEDDSEIKMIYAMLSYVNYTLQYLKISTLTGVSNTNFVMLMTSSTIVRCTRYMPRFATFPYVLLPFGTIY